MLSKEKITDGKWVVKFTSLAGTKTIAELIPDVDGFYYCWFVGRGGWEEYVLRYIADALHELNKDWQKHIEENFTQNDIQKEN